MRKGAVLLQQAWLSGLDTSGTVGFDPEVTPRILLTP
jgi:hypothetical protein